MSEECGKSFHQLHLNLLPDIFLFLKQIDGQQLLTVSKDWVKCIRKNWNILPIRLLEVEFYNRVKDNFFQWTLFQIKKIFT